MNIENETIGNEEMFFDEPIEIQTDEMDDVITYDHDFHNGISALGNDEDPSDDESDDSINFDDDDSNEEDQDRSSGEFEKGKSKDEIDFEDDLVEKKEEDDVFKAEEAIEKLKNLGYKIDKGNSEDPDVIRQNELQTLDKMISNIENFINQDDLVLCRQRVIQDLTEEYKKNGRSSEINGDDFKADVDAQMDEYNYNTRMASLEAKTIRNEMTQFISQKKAEKQKIENEIESDKAEKTRIHRRELQESFKGYKNKNLFGQKITEEAIKNAYKKMVSGEVAKTVNNDKNIQAEFALFLELRDEISKSGGGTYGEGVAAAVNALNGDTKPTKTSLNRTVQRPSSGNNLLDRYASWGARTEVKDNK